MPYRWCLYKGTRLLFKRVIHSSYENSMDLYDNVRLDVSMKIISVCGNPIGKSGKMEKSYDTCRGIYKTNMVKGCIYKTKIKKMD